MHLPLDQDARAPDATLARADDTPPLTGAVLAGRYVLGGLLGKGGMGRVHAAQDRTLSREVAVKVLASASPEVESLRRFQREALATSSVQHPNVVAVFDAGEEQGRPFIVTELLRGQTLRERMAAGPLPLDETLRIARQAAAGLAAAHEKGLTHRDFKPENIFITQDGWVKILDFGLVKLAEDLRTRQDDEPRNDEEAVTGVGRMLGTVGYMAPEQVRGRPVDPRADLFNFGAVLYEMISGKRAFRGNSPTETGYATLFKQPEPLSDGTPRAVRELVTRCLEKEPQKRFASGKEVLAAIEALISQPPPKPPRFRLRLSIPRRAWLAAGAAVLLAALVVAGLRMKKRAPVNAGPPPSGTVAILPFSSRDAPKFAWLGEGIVDLLARDLKGTDLHVVDSASVLRAVGGDVTADVDKVVSASAQLGAKYFVLGRIEERRGELLLEAVLHTGDGATPVSQAVAQGDPAQLLRLVRQLSDQLLLQHLPKQEFDARVDLLARQTSRSLPALQAWLEGERLLRRGGWTDSLRAFQRAASFDPDFTLAQYRLGVVAEFAEPGLAEDALQRALRYSDRLSPPERVLVRGRLAVQEGRFGDAENSFLDATRSYPDDPQTWMDLAELYFHQNPLRGRSPQQAEGPLQHVLILDPLNTEAIGHLSELALLRGERSVVAKLADRLLALVDDPALIISNRLTLAWARSDAAEEDRIINDVLKPGTSRAVLNSAFVRAEWIGDFSAAERVGQRSSISEAADERALGLYMLGMVELSRGRPEAARAELLRAAQVDPSGFAPYRAVWSYVLDFFPVTHPQLEAARAAAEQIDSSRAANLLPQKQALIGLLAARAGDTAAAEKAATVLEQMPPIEGSSMTRDLALTVRAELAAARHDAAGALGLLEKQQVRIPARQVPFYFRLSENRLRAKMLAQLGRKQEALQLYDALNIHSSVDAVYVPAAHLAKGKLLDNAGDATGAIEQYASFVEFWKDCESAERPEVEQALARLAQLRQADQRAAR